MAYQPEVREEARRLRATGASILDISRTLKVAKASASMWVRDVVLTEDQQVRLDTRARTEKHYLKAAQARSDQSKSRHKAWRREAEALWVGWSKEPLFMLGIGIYWGEGSRGSFSVSNSDPTLLRAWVRWCREYAPSIRIRASLQLYSGTDPEIATAYWETALAIPGGVTSISFFPVRAVRAMKRTLPNGVLQVALGVGATEWLVKMSRWMELA